MRILITNDDGIHAPGMAIMEKVARELSSDVWLVAPESEQSGTSHSLSLSNPIRVREISERHFAVRGSPTDCVIIGCNLLLKDGLPDLLISGINRGANTADDVTYSGTIAAAMEGTLLGVRSIALSQVFTRGQPVKWQTAERHAANVIGALAKAELRKGVFLNVNFPDVEPDQVRGIRCTRQGERTRQQILIDPRIDARGFPYYWLSFRHESDDDPPDTDLGAIAEGIISVTPLHCNLTHPDSRETVANLLSGVSLSQT
jgi:5'-nucleotidase